MNAPLENTVRNAKRIVFKIGSALLVNEEGKVSSGNLAIFVALFTKLREQGKEVVIVTSGSMVAANYDLKKSRAKYTLAEKQALCSIGQVQLMEHYERLFKKNGLQVGQILISKFSINHRPSYENAQNTIRQLLKMGVVPIINENDPLATEEIRFGENDGLGALASGLVESDLYVILSNIDGFYLYYGQKRQQKLDLVTSLTDAHWQAAKKGKSSLGQGGMLSKLEAVKIAASFGIPTLITNGNYRHISDLYQSIFLEKISKTKGITRGTLFLLESLEKSLKNLNMRQKWLLSNVTPKSRVVVDEGAEKAIIQGKSLLPKGVVKIVKESKGSDHFIAGSVCDILNLKGVVIARGICHFSGKDLDKIKGHSLAELANLLGHSKNKEVVHRNYLVLV